MRHFHSTNAERTKRMADECPTSVMHVSWTPDESSCTSEHDVYSLAIRSPLDKCDVYVGHSLWQSSRWDGRIWLCSWRRSNLHSTCEAFTHRIFNAYIAFDHFVVTHSQFWTFSTKFPHLCEPLRTTNEYNLCQTCYERVTSVSRRNDNLHKHTPQISQNIGHTLALFATVWQGL